jgi:diguanylate cyclase (GGDEF)-like protein
VTLVLVLVGVVLGVGVSQLWRVFGHRSRNHPRDTLTGLALRAEAHDALRALRAGDAVVMLDLDELKRVNDTQGHAAGDELLTAVAAHLSRGVRAQDTVARWGGDEFVIVLRGGADAASDVVERLRRSASTAFSAGIAVHASGDAEATLARADAALLAAKRAGGRRVMTG